MKSGKCAAMYASFLFVIGAFINPVSPVLSSENAESRSPSAVKGIIYEFLREREWLWNLPAPLGTRNIDVTDIICPVISRAEWEALHLRDPGFVKVIPAGPATGFSSGTVLFNVSGKVDLFKRQSLSVWITPEGDCIGRYRLDF